jgi:hypothetical protein
MLLAKYSDMTRQKTIRFSALLRFLTRARKEVDRCGDANAPLAGCVLLGAMTEFLLMATIRVFPGTVYRKGRKVGEHWDLKRLNDFAKECGWYDQDIYEAAERIRVTRNLLHPNWYASSKPKRITRSMLKAREDDFQKVFDCLAGLVV